MVSVESLISGRFQAFSLRTRRRIGPARMARSELSEPVDFRLRRACDAIAECLFS